MGNKKWKGAQKASTEGRRPGTFWINIKIGTDFAGKELGLTITILTMNCWVFSSAVITLKIALLEFPAHRS